MRWARGSGKVFACTASTAATPRSEKSSGLKVRAKDSRARRSGPPVPPAEYTKGAESVPAAGRAEMLKRKIRFPSVGVLQGPAAIF